MKWFRMYDEVLHDPKVQALRPELFKFWVNLLCLANQQNDRGTLPSKEEIARVMRIKRDCLERFTSELLARNLLVISSKGALKPYNWDSRQRSSDDSAKRKALSRERTYENRQVSYVTGQNGKCHVDVPSSRAPDTDSDTDTEKDSEYIYTRETVVGDPPSQLPSTPQRSPEERASIEAARSILAGGLDTETVARELDRLEDQSGYVTIPGWKFHVAAERQVLLSDPGKRRSPRYYFAMVRGIGDDEKPGPPRASQNGNGMHRETPYQHKMRLENERYKTLQNNKAFMDSLPDM